MLIASLRRRTSFAAVVVSLAIVQLTACGSDSPGVLGETPAQADAEDRTVDAGAGWGVARAQSSAVPPTADANATWSVVQKLSARDVEILYASFTPDVRDDLADIVHAAAEYARG